MAGITGYIIGDYTRTDIVVSVEVDCSLIVKQRSEEIYLLSSEAKLLSETLMKFVEGVEEVSDE